ncbi:MAG: hypothetical protein ACREMZ_16980 [Gemmatimonadales bacterium]
MRNKGRPSSPPARARRPIATLAWTTAILILGLNIWLVFGALREWLA